MLVKYMLFGLKQICKKIFENEDDIEIYIEIYLIVKVISLTFILKITNNA